LPPQYPDNDLLFRHHRWLTKLLILEDTKLKSVPRIPLSHPFAERLIRTIRRADCSPAGEVLLPGLYQLPVSA